MTAIACDIDGVVANFCAGFSKLCHTLNPDAPIINYHDVTAWNWHDWYGHDDTIEEAWKIIRADPSQELFWLGLDPMFDLTYLRSVYREWPVVFMTRRDGGLAWFQTAQWLGKQGIDEPLLYKVRSGEEKSKLCAKLGISTIIEDSPAYAQEALDAGMNVVLVTYQYNVHIPKQKRLRRVFNLERALIVARRMNEKV